MRSGPWRKRPQNEHQREVKLTDIAVSKMVRIRDTFCITCDQPHDTMDCGHFRRRECMATRFHPMNVNAQGVKENRFEGGRMYEYGLAIDRTYGAGWAAFLYKLSQKIEPWETKELQQLRSAAKMGFPVFKQVYFELRPHHWFEAAPQKAPQQRQ